MRYRNGMRRKATGLVLGCVLALSASAQMVGDFNDDGLVDLAMYDPITTSWYIQSDDGTLIVDGVILGAEGAIPLIGDFNGDGISDLAVYHPDTAMWDILGVDGTVLAQELLWGAQGVIPLTGDFNGDGASDLAVYHPDTGNWDIRTLGGTTLADGVTLGIPNAQPVPGDYNGDGAFDLAVYVAATGKWYIQTLAGMDIVWGQDWGFPGTIAVSGDFDGDGIHDLAVYAPATGKWYIRDVAGNVVAMEISAGPAHAMPMAGDINGDGYHDLIVFGPKPSQTWGIRSVPGDYVLTGLQVDGAPKSSVPVGPVYAPGEINYTAYRPLNDFNGDGASDLAVYHPDTGNWFIRTLGGETLAWFRSWGYPGTLPVPADYTGNGIADLAVYDPANGKWFIVTMDHQHVAMGVQWGGFPGAVPVPGDYDGDGVTDLGIYDRHTGLWYVWSLAKQEILIWAQPWGWPGDVRPWERPPTSTVIPVPYDYDGDGKTDLAVYYRGVSMETTLWYILGSTGASWVPTGHWGSSGSIAAPGRYAQFDDPRWPMGVSAFGIGAQGRPQEWNTPMVGGHEPGAGIYIGTFGRTLPVPAHDFDGNGWDDMAVYDYLDGTWTLILSTGDGNTIRDQPSISIPWGFPGAIPANIYSSIYRACNYSIRPW